MSELILKRHDTWPEVRGTLEETNPSTGLKVPIDLTGAVKVNFLMKNSLGTEAAIEGTCTFTDRPNGKVSYAWKPGDTGTAGTYNVEFEIEWSGTQIETVPNAGYDTIKIEPDLGVA